jgi:hypothetical protein
LPLSLSPPPRLSVHHLPFFVASVCFVPDRPKGLHAWNRRLRGAYLRRNGILRGALRPACNLVSPGCNIVFSIQMRSRVLSPCFGRPTYTFSPNETEDGFVRCYYSTLQSKAGGRAGKSRHFLWAWNREVALLPHPNRYMYFEAMK